MATKPEKSAGNAKRPDNKKKKPAFSAQDAREQKKLGLGLEKRVEKGCWSG